MGLSIFINIFFELFKKRLKFFPVISSEKSVPTPQQLNLHFEL